MAHRLDRWRWWIELDAEATIALVQGDLGPAYVLLHESGSLMRDENGVIAEDSWANICTAARENSALFIFSLHDKRVIRVAYGPVGVYVDSRYVFFVADRDALQSVTMQDGTVQEILREEAKATGPKRKQISGAEKRRRKRNSGT